MYFNSAAHPPMGTEEESLQEERDRKPNEKRRSRRSRNSLRADIPDSSRSNMHSGLPPAGIMLTPISPDASVKASEDDDTDPTPQAVVEDDDQWLVECIVGHRIHYPKRARKPENQYLVRWLGFGSKDDQWVREEDIDPAIVETYRFHNDPLYKASSAVVPEQPRKRGRPPKKAPVSKAGKKLVLEIPASEPRQRKSRKNHSVSPVSSTALYRSVRVLNRKLSGNPPDLAS